MSWTWAALMPHPPIIIPEVGQGRENEAAETLQGTERICARIRECNQVAPPDVLLLLSPHAPYAAHALFINVALRPHGNLKRFGAPMVGSALITARKEIDELAPALINAGIAVNFYDVPDITSDHGSLVPLYYLSRTFADSTLPHVIMANPSGLSPQQALKLGQTLRGFGHSKRWALLASGDLSHRLKPGAPSGFHRDGRVFDQAVVEAVKAGDPAILAGLDPSVLQNAGECGLRPVLALLGLCQAPLEVFSYEGPFGVGYCNALWPGDGRGDAAQAGPTATAGAERSGTSQDAAPAAQAGPAATAGAERSGTSQDAASAAPRARIGKITLVPVQPEKQPDAQGREALPGRRPENGRSKHAAAGIVPQERHPYARLARKAIAALLQGEPAPDKADIAALSPDADLWNVRKGCFVSIKNKDGSLRGCIGTFGPTQPDLAREIMVNAAAAATRDPRFPAMKAAELANVRISVDVLSEPELVEEGMELDPAVWGVIVSSGPKRGLLLPDLPTVTSVEQQIGIAARKGGISDLSKARIHRFTVSRYLEGVKEDGQ